MAAASAMILGGTGLSIMGQAQSSKAEAEAEFANAAYLKEQADFAREAGRRTVNAFDVEAAEFLGNQKSGFSAGGVALSGSPLAVIGDTLARQGVEREGIKLDSFAKEREALLKAGASYSNAKKLSNWKSRFLPAAGTGLVGGASAMSASPNKKGQI